MSTAEVSRTVFFALLCCAAFTRIAHSQSVVFKHSVVADVMPVVSVRDSIWSDARNVGDGATRTTWSGEIRANSVSEVQVMGPRDPERSAYARTTGGQWVRLEPGAWYTIVVVPAGLRRISIDVDAGVRPAVRVVPR